MTEVMNSIYNGTEKNNTANRHGDHYAQTIERHRTIVDLLHFHHATACMKTKYWLSKANDVDCA
jgi:hypothetical protein